MCLQQKLDDVLLGEIISGIIISLLNFFLVFCFSIICWVIERQQSRLLCYHDNIFQSIVCQAWVSKDMEILINLTLIFKLIIFNPACSKYSWGCVYSSMATSIWKELQLFFFHSYKSPSPTHLALSHARKQAMPKESRQQMFQCLGLYMIIMRLLVTCACK